MERPITKYREIAGLDGYRFGSDGSVWSQWVERHHVLGDEWRQLQTHRTKRGYLIVKLAREHGTSPFLIHQLILTAFVGPKPYGMGGCHKDGDNKNNAIDNLYWGDQRSNTVDSMNHGTFKPMIGTSNGRSKLTKGQVISVFQLSNQGWSQIRIANNLGVSKTTIWLILNGKSWTHISKHPDFPTYIASLRPPPTPVDNS